MKTNKIIILLLSIAFVFCACFLATALVNDHIGGSNNQSKNESDTLITDNGLIDKNQTAKETEYNAFYDNVEKETFELLSKYTNAKLNVKITGSAEGGTEAYVGSQSPEAGQSVATGTIVTVEALYKNVH